MFSFVVVFTNYTPPSNIMTFGIQVLKVTLSKHWLITLLTSIYLKEGIKGLTGR